MPSLQSFLSHFYLSKDKKDERKESLSFEKTMESTQMDRQKDAKHYIIDGLAMLYKYKQTYVPHATHNPSPLSQCHVDVPCGSSVVLSEATWPRCVVKNDAQ